MAQNLPAGDVSGNDLGGAGVGQQGLAVDADDRIVVT